jgi:CRP-like cAMP-binding protein
LNILRQIYFFSRLPLDTLKVLAYLCQRERFKAGDTLFQQNDDDGQALYIVSGDARLLYNDGSQDIEIRNCTEGDFIGGLSLVGKMERLFSLEATTDTVCLILYREKFAKAMDQFPDQTPMIFQALVDRVRTWERQFIGDHAASCDHCIQSVGVSLL